MVIDFIAILAMTSVDRHIEKEKLLFEGVWRTTWIDCPVTIPSLTFSLARSYLE